MINRGSSDVKLGTKQQKAGREAAAKFKRAGNNPDLSSLAKRESRKILAASLSGQEIFLIGELRQGRVVGDESQLEVIDDSVHNGIVGEESDNAYLSGAYFSMRSASLFVLARTRLWTLNPVWRQERILLAHSGLRSSPLPSVPRKWRWR